MCQLQPSKRTAQEEGNHSNMLYNLYANDSVRDCPTSRPCCLKRQSFSALPHAAAVMCGIGWPPEGNPRSMGVCHSPHHAPPGATRRTRILQVMHVRWLPQSLQVSRDTLFPANRRCSPWCCPGIVHKRKEGLVRFTPPPDARRDPATATYGL
jgi:hypothetical protein